MKKSFLVVSLAALSAIAQEVAVRAPDKAPSDIERLGLIGCLAAAVVYQSLKVEKKDEALRKAEEENREMAKRMATLTERVTEAVEQLEKAVDVLRSLNK